MAINILYNRIAQVVFYLIIIGCAIYDYNYVNQNVSNMNQLLDKYERTGDPLILNVVLYSLSMYYARWCCSVFAIWTIISFVLAIKKVNIPCLEIFFDLIQSLFFLTLTSLVAKAWHLSGLIEESNEYELAEKEQHMQSRLAIVTLASLGAFLSLMIGIFANCCWKGKFSSRGGYYQAGQKAGFAAGMESGIGMKRMPRQI